MQILDQFAIETLADALGALAVLSAFMLFAFSLLAGKLQKVLDKEEAANPVPPAQRFPIDPTNLDQLLALGADADADLAEMLRVSKLS